jgi:hypothetical protein
MRTSFRRGWPGLSMRSICAGSRIHLKPGAGDLDFGDMFRRIDGKGFTGHYMNAFGSLDDMLTAREDLARQAEAAE